jgi:hypothetical protein
LIGIFIDIIPVRWDPYIYLSLLLFVAFRLCPRLVPRAVSSRNLTSAINHSHPAHSHPFAKYPVCLSHIQYHFDASSTPPRIGGSFRTKSHFSQRCAEFKGGTMVNTDAQAHKPSQAPSQQCTSTPKMFNGNFIVINRHLDTYFAYAAKGTGSRFA